MFSESTNLSRDDLGREVGRNAGEANEEEPMAILNVIAYTSTLSNNDKHNKHHNNDDNNNNIMLYNKLYMTLFYNM